MYSANSLYKYRIVRFKTVRELAQVMASFFPHDHTIYFALLCLLGGIVFFTYGHHGPMWPSIKERPVSVFDYPKAMIVLSLHAASLTS